MRTARAGLALLVVAVLGACSASSPATTATTSVAASASGPTSAPSPIPAATPESSGPTLLRVCHDGQRCDVVAGSYLTGASGFFPGLAITIPIGWGLGEEDAGELSLGAYDRRDDRVELWKDVRVVVSNHLTEPAGTIVKSVAPTPDAIIEWFTTDKDFHVLEKPEEVTIAGVTGKALAVDISKTANYGDPGCPANPHCADFLTDPRHWGNGFFGTGGEDADWMFFATAHYPSGDHLFALVLAARSPADLMSFKAEAQPVIDGLLLPTTYTDN
jgi:hypothetical protein